jgi:hypothetical protein
MLSEEPMNAAIEQILRSFDALPKADKHSVAVEILKRESASAQGDVPETALVEAADELFLAMDAAEVANAEG